MAVVGLSWQPLTLFCGEVADKGGVVVVVGEVGGILSEWVRVSCGSVVRGGWEWYCY